MKALPVLILMCALTASCSKRGESTTLVKPKIKTEEVQYQVGDSDFTGYFAWNENNQGERPGVIVVHQWWGHSDYVRERARMLAEMGYTALALDMYGVGKLATHPSDAQAFMKEAVGNTDVAKARFMAAYDLLQQHETTADGQIAAIGYCFGGAVVLQMARFGTDLDGVASFHGNLATQTPAKPGAVKGKVLVLHGADDPLVPPEQVEAFKKEMTDAKVDYELVVYPGANHAFTDKGATAKGQKFDMPLAYDEAADKDSWARLEAFLKQIF